MAKVRDALTTHLKGKTALPVFKLKKDFQYILVILV